MRAVHVIEHGGPEVLRMVDLPAPTAGPGEVLARVVAVSLNHLDVWVRRGMPGVDIPMPHVPGCDGTGVIEAVGEGVDPSLVGRTVVLEPGYTLEDGPETEAGLDHLAPDYGIRGEHAPGLAAERVVLPARHVTPIPEGVDPVAAAALPLVFLTAWGMLFTRAELRPGETALVLGAASGVGSAGIQLAKERGATVITTASTEAKRALGADLGADHVLDHTDPEWPRQVKALTGGAGVDVVLEHIGPATWGGAMRCLARRGRLVTCGGTTGPKVEIALPHLFMKNQSVLGSTMGPRGAIAEVLEGVARGALRPVVDRVLPIEDIAEAHRLLEGRGVVGKLVLTF